MNIDTLYGLDGGWTLAMLVAMNGDLLDGLGVDPFTPELWSENPVNKIVKDVRLWHRLARMGGVNGTQLIRSQVICQQAMWHFGSEGRGPEGDGLPKTLRKLWYAGHKDAIQHISQRLGIWRGNGQMNDVAANGAMIRVYGEFVDTRLATYLDLFAKDSSRQFEMFSEWYRLPKPLSNIVLCIEKDAAFEDCVRIGKALGVAVALSGGGKMGKAGTERMVREALSSWDRTDTPGDLVTPDNSLYVLAISDWDYDGEAVIAPTFVRQMERYIDPTLINWVRVGIKPRQVEDMGYNVQSKGYQVKYHVNSAYTNWCRSKAVFNVEGTTYNGLEELREDRDWLYEQFFLKYPDGIPEPHELGHSDLKDLFERFPPLGYELDALKRTEYASIIIEGLLTMIAWEDLIGALSHKAWSRNGDVVDILQREVLDANKDYQELTKHIGELQQEFEDRIGQLESQQREFSDKVYSSLMPLVQYWDEDERITKDDNKNWATKEKMANHLRMIDAFNHWQPFSSRTRNDCHAEVVREEQTGDLERLKAKTISFERIEL